MNDLTLLLLAISGLTNVFLLVRSELPLRLLRAGMVKAEADRCDTVRLPYNQVGDVLRITPQFIQYFNRRTGEKLVRQKSVFPIADRPGQNVHGHPATMTPSRRGKL